MLPELTIDLKIVEQNTRRVAELCAERGIGITGITKVFRGDPEIARAFVRGGVKALGDSRTENLSRLSEAGIDIEKWLIRMPQISRAEECVRTADVSLNSEEETIRALSDAWVRVQTTREAERADNSGAPHGIVLMHDLGDLREGWVDYDGLAHAAELVRSLPGLELKGIGTNLTCFNFVHPDTEKLTQLADAARSLGADTYVSGGNSATLDLMLKGGIPAGVNLLRLGESLLFGRERAHYAYLPGTRNDAFILRAEIIELKEKPSMPWGTFGVDSYGRAPEHHDRGVRRRAICALGRQDADFETLWTVDPGVEILGASSDHLMVDVTDAEREYRMGDVIELRCGYYALLRAYNSDYVAKRYLR